VKETVTESTIQSPASQPIGRPAQAPIEINAFKAVGIGKALIAIFIISALALTFLMWLIYFKRGEHYSSTIINSLAGVNALFNSISATLLVLGFIAIKQRNYMRHARLMLGALGSSTLFLICYIIYHNFHGDTKFLATGAVRPIYFIILISHIVLSAVSAPLVLLSFFLALSGKLRLHRRVSVYTLPIWLYVSVTGVLVFAMLKWFNPAE
jgi:putative membrane protein